MARGNAESNSTPPRSFSLAVILGAPQRTRKTRPPKKSTSKKIEFKCYSTRLKINTVRFPA